MSEVQTPDRRILVTGGTRGIGRAIAAAFRADGASVTITGRDAAALATVERELGVRTAQIDADRPDDIERLRDLFADGLDVLVNNAGGFAGGAGADASLAELAAAWRRDLDRNVVS